MRLFSVASLDNCVPKTASLAFGNHAAQTDIDVFSSSCAQQQVKHIKQVRRSFTDKDAVAILKSEPRPSIPTLRKDQKGAANGPRRWVPALHPGTRGHKRVGRGDKRRQASEAESSRTVDLIQSETRLQIDKQINKCLKKEPNEFKRFSLRVEVTHTHTPTYTHAHPHTQ